MPQSYVQYRGNGSTTTFAVPFSYLNRAHVTAKVGGVPAGFLWSGDTIISLTHVVPADGAVVEVRRITPNTQRLVDFVDGSTLTESDLDQNSTQFLYLSQEALDRANEAPLLTAQNTYDFQGRRATNVADPVDAQDAVTKTWAETAQTSLLAQTNTARTAAIAAAAEARDQATTATAKATAAAASEGAARGHATASSGSASAAEAAAQRAEYAAAHPANPGGGTDPTAIHVGDNAIPSEDWLHFSTHEEGILVNAGAMPVQCFPGGNTVGCYSALMGVVDIKTPGQNQGSTFAAGIGGIARSTMSNPSPCGVFGAAMANTPDATFAQVFPANFVVTNQRDLNPYTTSGVKRAEMYGIEIDMEVHPADDGTPMEGHARGIWITGNSRVQPTGEFTGVLIGPAGILRTPRIPWKKAFRSQLGAAEVAFEAGELKETGACSSQPITMIGRNSAGQSLTASVLTDQDGNLLARIPGAAMVIQNASAGTGITLRTDGRLSAINADLSSNLTVGGNGVVNGTLTASTVSAGIITVSSNGSVGGNLTVNATLTASTTNTGTLNVSSNAGIGGNVTVNGSVTAGTGSFGSMYFQGQPVFLCAAGPIPAGYKGLMIPA